MNKVNASRSGRVITPQENLLLTLFTKIFYPLSKERGNTAGFPLLAVICLVITLSGLLLPAPAHAAEFSGKYLLHVCSSDKQGKELVPGGHTACQAYIAGIMDYHTLIKSLKTAPGLDFCIPKDTPLPVIQEGIVFYLLKNGQHDDFIASPAVAIALNQMYPCKK